MQEHNDRRKLITEHLNVVKEVVYHYTKHNWAYLNKIHKKHDFS